MKNHDQVEDNQDFGVLDKEEVVEEPVEETGKADKYLPEGAVVSDE